MPDGSSSPAPAVSVVVPTFNRPLLLRRALESLAGQTFGDFEVVVVNDAGLDPSPVLAGFAGRLRLLLETHPANRGLAAARNTGISSATGRYLALLDDDDLYLPEHLATLVARAEALGGRTPVYSQGWQVLEDANGRPLSRQVLPAPPAFDEQLIRVTNFIPVLCLLLPAAQVRQAGGFDETLEVLEDWELWIRLAAGRPFVHLPAPTCEYRLRGGAGNSTTREAFRFQQCLERVYAKHPVPKRSRLAELRRQMLEGSAARAEAYAYDYSVLVASHGRVDRLVGCLESVVEVLAGRSYEVVLHAPATPAVLALAGQLEGDVTVLLGQADDEAAWSVCARKAAGRAVVRLREDEVLTADRLPVAAVPGVPA